jgi:integrase
MTRLPFIVAIRSSITLLVTCVIVRPVPEARNGESTSSSATLAARILRNLPALARRRIAVFALRGVRVFAAGRCQKRIDGRVRVDASEFIQEVRRKVHLPWRAYRPRYTAVIWGRSWPSSRLMVWRATASCVRCADVSIDRGDSIALKGSWTKGGRPRTVPITTSEQRTVLDLAHQLAGAGSLIPGHKSYIQQRHIYDGQCKAAGLSHMHGLRHHYAQERYEALTGWKSPAAGGPVARRSSAGT